MLHNTPKAPETFFQYVYWSTRNLFSVHVLEHPKLFCSTCTGAPETFSRYMYWSTQNLFPVRVLEKVEKLKMSLHSDLSMVLVKTTESAK